MSRILALIARRANWIETRSLTARGALVLFLVSKLTSVTLQCEAEAELHRFCRFLNVPAAVQLSSQPARIRADMKVDFKSWPM